MHQVNPFTEAHGLFRVLRAFVTTVASVQVPHSDSLNYAPRDAVCFPGLLLPILPSFTDHLVRSRRVSTNRALIGMLRDPGNYLSTFTEAVLRAPYHSSSIWSISWLHAREHEILQ